MNGGYDHESNEINGIDEETRNDKMVNINACPD
jgi:hypothetical protein